MFKKERIFLSVLFGVLTVSVIVNGFIFYFNAITFVFAGIFLSISIIAPFGEKIIDKIEDKIFK